MGLETSLAIAALVVATVGTGVSVHQSIEAAEQGEKAAEARRKAQQLKQDKERRKQIRSQRIERARILNAAGSQGLGGDTVLGAAQVPVAESSVNRGFLNQQSALAAEETQALNAQGRAQANSSIASGVAALGQFAAANSSTIGSAFKKPETTTPTATAGRTRSFEPLT